MIISHIRAGWNQFVRDVTTDRWLRLILLLAVTLCGFWFWHRIPNFATRDEFSRIMDTLVPYARVIEDPSLESLRSGIEWGRAPFGASTYLYGLVLLPVVVAALLFGDGNAFTALAYPDWESRMYEQWHLTPRWIWTWSIGLARLVTVVFAVGSVYLTYRIGVELADRPTGRLASLVLSLTFGFLMVAHEGGEDVPAVFFGLLSLLLLIHYVDSGNARYFLGASAVGGLAIGFKVTAAPIIIVILIAYLTRVLTEDPETVFYKEPPKLLAVGALTGLLVIILSFPSSAVGHFDLVVYRIFGGAVNRPAAMTGPDAPILWWFLRGYFSGLGLPLFIGSIGGVLGALWQMRRRPVGTKVAVLIFTWLFGFLLLFSTWHDFRVHHLLPTFPILAILVGWSLAGLRKRSSTIGRVALVLVVITSASYAGVGVAEYADMPRDQASDWLVTHGDDTEVIEVYRRHFQDTAVPHSMNLSHSFGSNEIDESRYPCPTYIHLGYRDLLYLVNGSYYRNSPHKADYLRNLLNGDYGYEIAAEFGPRPPNFVPNRPEPGNYRDLIRLGIVPHSDQYADEQELAENQYTLILEQTGECNRSRDPPF